MGFFRQRKPMKFEISTFLPVRRNFTVFWYTELKTTIQISLKLFRALQCKDRKLQCKFFSQAIYLLDKTNPQNLKFWPSRLLQENSSFLGRLNRKPQFRFCWNFPELFSVRRRNWCVTFLLKQFIF